MDKVLVRLKIPAIEESYDIFTPVDMPIEDLIKIIIPAIVESSNGRYVSSGREMLSRYDNPRLLNGKFSLKDYGIGDGACVMLL